MARRRLQNARASAYRIVFIQSAVITVLAGVFLYIYDLKTAYSLWLGGAICVLPQSYFIWHVFAKTGALQARQVVAGFFCAQAVKMIITGLVFYWVYRFLSVSMLILLAGYVGAYAVYVIAPLVIKQ